MSDDACCKKQLSAKGMFCGRSGGRCGLCRQPLSANQAQLHCVTLHPHKEHDSTNTIFALCSTCHGKTLCAK